MMLLLLLFDYWYSSDLCVTTVLASLLPAKSNPHSVLSSIMFEVSLQSYSFGRSCRFWQLLQGSMQLHLAILLGRCSGRVLVLLLIFYWVLGSWWYYFLSTIILRLFYDLFGGLSFQGFCYLPFYLLYLRVHYYCCTSVLWYIVLWYIKPVKLRLSSHFKF